MAMFWQKFVETVVTLASIVWSILSCRLAIAIMADVALVLLMGRICKTWDKWIFEQYWCNRSRHYVMYACRLAVSGCIYTLLFVFSLALAQTPAEGEDASTAMVASILCMLLYCVAVIFVLWDTYRWRQEYRPQRYVSLGTALYNFFF